KKQHQELIEILRELYKKKIKITEKQIFGSHEEKTILLRHNWDYNEYQELKKELGISKVI
ncbi:hypothetical protein N9901_03560, partial [Flavobacteriaceae bacterium]|nr:hypothetical protein [Flavobacteriaceae bacterium]